MYAHTMWKENSNTTLHYKVYTTGNKESNAKILEDFVFILVASKNFVIERLTAMPYLCNISANQNTIPYSNSKNPIRMTTSIKTEVDECKGKT